MGMDFHVYKKANECQCCGRYNKEEIIYVGNDLFTESIAQIIENDSGITLLYGSRQLNLFSEHFMACENYSGDDVLKRLSAVKDIIKPEYYMNITKALSEDGTYMTAWW